MIWNFDPVAISLFGLDIRWYSLVYIAGFFLALKWGYQLQKRTLTHPFSKDRFENLTFGIFVAGVIGGRLGHFLFFDASVFGQNFWEIFRIWNGGMSIHGGLLGSCIWAWWWCRRQNVSLLKMADVFMLPLAVILIFGRLGNFLNGELVGRPTETDWGMIFPHVDNLLRHPSQLYEVAKNGIISLLLLYFWTNQWWKKTGFLTVLFLTSYGILRFSIEFFKEPTATFGYVSVGQILSFGMILFAFYLAKIQNFWQNTS
jgi:phosphatidylglycerol:prolipoprotein diacylglycerol transferase